MLGDPNLRISTKSGTYQTDASNERPHATLQRRSYLVRFTVSRSEVPSRKDRTIAAQMRAKPESCV